MAMTLKAEFEDLLRTLFSGEIDRHSEPYRGLRMAFFSGAVVAGCMHPLTLDLEIKQFIAELQGEKAATHVH